MLTHFLSFLDSGQFAEWRVQMGARVLPERDMEIHTTASRVCQEESRAVGNGKTGLQR